jgi:hypothetical protein
MKQMKNILLSILLLGFATLVVAQKTNYQTESNIPYYNESIIKSDEYIKERCVLDIYYPENITDFATVVWFHGGGLTGGNKELPEELKEKGSGDRELEMLGRYEENAYLMRMMIVAGHKDTRIFELDGYGHGMTKPAFPLLINELKRIIEKSEH